MDVTEKNDQETDSSSGWLEVKKKHKSKAKSTNAKDVGLSARHLDSQRKPQRGTYKVGSLEPEYLHQNACQEIVSLKNYLSNANLSEPFCEAKPVSSEHFLEDNSNVHGINKEKVKQAVPEITASYVAEKVFKNSFNYKESQEVKNETRNLSVVKESISNSILEDMSQEDTSGSIVDEKSKVSPEIAENQTETDYSGTALLPKRKISSSPGEDALVNICSRSDDISGNQIPKIKWGNLDEDLEFVKPLKNVTELATFKTSYKVIPQKNVQVGCGDSTGTEDNEKCSKDFDNEKCSKDNLDSPTEIAVEHQERHIPTQKLELSTGYTDVNGLSVCSSDKVGSFEIYEENPSDLKVSENIQNDRVYEDNCTGHLSFSDEPLSLANVSKEASAQDTKSEETTRDSAIFVHKADGLDYKSCSTKEQKSGFKEPLLLTSDTETSSIQETKSVNTTPSSEVSVHKSEDIEFLKSSTEEQKSSSKDFNNASSSSHSSKGPKVTSAEEQLHDVKFAANMLFHAFDKGDAGESKERFRQRLWCFLFENLNRAIHELYLLCELECDCDQMNEASIVLEEALSDFRELKSRVERFDKAEDAKPASQTLSNVILAKSKLEHRRPHSLSWEVRRLTSSPHRAEILSSSLEAFRKIQEAAASKQAVTLTKIRANKEIPRKPLDNSGPTSSSKDLGSKLKGKLLIKSELVNKGSLTEKKHTDSLPKGSKENSLEARVNKKEFSSISSQTAGKKNGTIPCPTAAFTQSNKERVASLTSKAPVTGTVIHKASKQPDSTHCQVSNVDKDNHLPVTKAPLDAWKEKRNWENVLKPPLQGSARGFHSPIISRKSAERARVLHDKLMSPERRRKSPLDMKRDAEEKHARAVRIRRELENERTQRLQKVSEKLSRVSEWQAVKSSKLREGMYARQQRGESRHEAYLAQIARRASDESNKVSEVRFITSLSEENKKLSLQQKLYDSGQRRAERLQIIKTKQKEDIAREEAVLERRKLLEAEKLQRLAETQRKKDEAQARREEERKAANAAREAKAVEQVRKKEVRAKAQREEAELQAKKLAERLRESELRRKQYLEQIREKAAMDFRDQVSPLSRQPISRDGVSRSASQTEFCAGNAVNGFGSYIACSANSSQQQSSRKRIKKIRQRLVALKHEFVEPPTGPEGFGIGSSAFLSTARSKIGRWLQELQKMQQSRKVGISNISVTIGELVKYLDGKDAELHAARQSGLIDFVTSALPPPYTSKTETCQTTILLLRILKSVLTLAANRSYFLVRNFLPPLVLMLSTTLENYCTTAASINSYSSVFVNCISSSADKTSDEKLESIGKVLEGLLWCIGTMMGHACSTDRQLQMKNCVAELIVACRVVHHLRDFFSLFDRPQTEVASFPSPVLLGLGLLNVLTSPKGGIFIMDWESQSAVTVLSRVPSVCTENEDNSVCLQGYFFQNLSEGEGKSCFMRELKEDDTAELSSTQKMKEKYGSSENREPCILVDSLESSGVTIKASDQEQVVNMENVDIMLPKKDEENSVDVIVLDTNNVAVQVGDNKKVSGKVNKAESEQAANHFTMIVSVIAETDLVGLLSLLNAILLQANPRSNLDQVEYILPSNFEEVATGVLRIMNNLARSNLVLIQNMLARPDLQMEFFHLMSFLLSYCTPKWKTTTDQVAILLFEVLLLLGYFALLHPGNQAVLRWGKSPTILHKICDLPFAFFSDPHLTPVLVGTLLAACYGCEQNRNVVQQELSMDMLLVLFKSSKQDKSIHTDSRLSAIPGASNQLDGPSSSSSEQNRTVIPTAEEMEIQVQQVLPPDPTIVYPEDSEKKIVDLPAPDISDDSHNQSTVEIRANPSNIQNANNAKKDKITNKATSQVESLMKESLGIKANGGKITRSKSVSLNKENMAQQTKSMKSSNSVNTPKGSVSTMSKRSNLSVTSNLRTNADKVARDQEDNLLLSPIFMLNNRFPIHLIDQAQDFFAAGLE